MQPQQSSEYTLLLAPVTAATTARTAQFDLSGSDYATVVVTAGVELNTNSTNVVVTLAHSDGTNHTTLATNTLDNTAATKREYHVNPMGKAKFLRLTVTPDTTTNGPVITSALVIADKDKKAASAGTVVE